MSQRRATITALGTYVPERVVTNADLAKIVDTSDEWIRTRTGIETRHYVEPGTPTSVIAAKAAREALRRRGIGADELDLIIVATVTPDMLFPATGCLVQDLIGAKRAWGFDVSAACSGFVYALTMGAQFVESGRHKKVMVIGADVMTSILDYKDRTTCVLFGDGAGAVILEPARGRLGHPRLRARGRTARAPATCTCPPAAASGPPPTRRSTRVCTTSSSRASTSSSTRCASSPTRASSCCSATASRGEDVDLFVAHQANIRIIEAAQHRLGLPDAKVVKNIRRYGNTTAATIPLALETALDEKRLAPGHLVLLAAVGAGFTVGTVLCAGRE